MLHHFVSAGVFGDKGTQLHILYGNLFNTHPAAYQLAHLFLCHILFGENTLQFYFLEIIFQALYQSVKCDLGSIRDKRNYGMLQVVIQRLQHSAGKVAAQFHTLSVYIRVAAAAEVDALKAAGGHLSWRQYFHIAEFT